MALPQQYKCKKLYQTIKLPQRGGRLRVHGIELRGGSGLLRKDDAANLIKQTK